jgi:hypothetical protein
MFNDTIKYEYNHSDKIVIIGDIHGDLKRLKKILIDAKIINNNIEWIADPPNTIVVQLGDQIDSLNRKDDIENWEILKDIEVLYFTNNLNDIARSKGGLFISLIGNHELMNVMGNFSYVADNSSFNLREEYFKPNGTLSDILSKRPIVVKIGPLIFCHAGIKKEHITIMDKYNKPLSYINDIWKQYIKTNKIKIEDKEIFDKLLLSQNGILWTRSFDDDNEIDSILEKLNCKYMFVGHNTVDNIGLYKNKIWLVDNGISRSFGKTAYEYIEINNYKLDIKSITE